MAALPSLRHVEFSGVGQDDCSVGIHPDPLEPTSRRFVQRFPMVTVRIEFDEEEWEETEEMRVVQLRYVGWPSVKLFQSDSAKRLGRPPSPRARSDGDDSGSDVAELEDPLAAAER